ncbi:hypothetical protein HMPREF0872_06355 [Veillonella montpellierensis DNF00314]|uniref:Type I restriction modification DNA specificity domain-containing protein n=1 Tax=Veillonella montpellierensis DNF00314 TaxID=1401067 RepID=A0A096AJG1_9FIRM|nr:restriction endonuclease subunit S [Veillonella montpellierensis]KGF46985.1 hypothetical protein HMPREF0872_06355 [Veillonella montpellierensis DNF00314]
MVEWIDILLSDILMDKGYIRGPFGSALKRGDMKEDGIPVYEQQHAIYNSRDFRYYIDEQKFNEMKRFQVKKDDLIISCSGTVGKVSIIKDDDPKGIISQALLLLRADTNKVLPLYLKYFFSSREGYNAIVSRSSGSVQVNIAKRSVIEQIPLKLPQIKTQRKIVGVLSSIDEKIEENERINNNLEQQLNAIFVNMFADKIDNLEDDSTTLADLVDTVDNRGKTPPLSVGVTDYPIIDVKALSGNSRIIDYNNCTKYVSEDTYNTWFRSGHPQPEDILISTVGSLAEMKIFLGDIGCIAQNVVGFRSKEISPYYLYQYLNYIKHDLVAYNIGSVQPSIKVTHIIKHAIYVPDEQQIKAFDTLARSISNRIFANCKENKNLTQLKDSLLPKLMSGELDVSDIDL